MSMMWVKKQSKWAIVAAALLIGGSLIMMDLPSSQGMSSGQSIGEVEGEEISTAAFQQDLQNYLRGEEARTGGSLDAGQQAQIRRNLFQSRVQNLILQRMSRAYRLRASIEEMQDYLLRNPHEVAGALAQYEGPESVPPFLRDSTPDMLRYRGWLAQDSVYDRPGLRMLEHQLKTVAIPQLQLQQVFRSQVHRTDLEEAFLLETREDKGVLRHYGFLAESFRDPAPPGEEALKAHFEANPDSFWFRDEAVRLNFVRFPLVPAAADTALMQDFARELRDRVLAGESFEDLARSYSADPGSAQNGGRLPAAARTEWVVPFADAAFSLSSGQISQPVLSPYGYHVILLHEKKLEGGVEKAAVSHILLNITVGTETLDSLTSRAETLKEQAEKSGLQAAAAAIGLPVEKTAVFEKGGVNPLGSHVPGMSSFAFSPAERKARISEPLQSEQAVFVLERDAGFPKGRDFERARDAVSRDFIRSAKLEAARGAAERARSEILAAKILPQRVEGAELGTTGLISAASYVPGFGFRSPVLFKALRQPRGEWGPVLATPEGAVLAQVVEFQPMPAAERAQKIRAARFEGERYQISNLYQQWVQELPQSVRVKDHLDEVYRN